MDAEPYTDEMLASLIRQCGGDDIESGHWSADKLLLEQLSRLGFKKSVEEFEELSKWYA